MTRNNRRLPLLFSLFALLVGVALLYRPLLLDWFSSLYNDPTYSYGLWVPFLAAYLIYLKISQIGPERIRTYFAPGYTGYLVIAAGCLLLLVGEISTLLYIARLSFLIVLAGIALTIIGRRGLSVFSFPAGYLLFALPLPTLVYLPLSARLQMVSSILAGKSLDLLGVPAIREGNIITLPTTQLEVIEACSGIHTLFALLAVATLAGYLLRSRKAERLLISLSAIPLAILLNAARITSLGVLSYQVGPDAAAGFAHMTTGVVIFAIGCAVILGLCKATGGPRSERKTVVQEASASSEAGIAFPWVNLTVAVALLGLAVALRGNIGFDRPVSLRQELSHFPVDLGGWKGHDLSIPAAQLAVLRASAVLAREYTRAADPPTTLYVAYFATQREGTSMHSPLHCIPGAGWEVEQQSVLPISSIALGSIRANKVIFANDGNRMLVVYWYMEQGISERSELQGAFATLWHAIFEQRSDGCLIRVSAPIVESEQKTLNEELTFISESAPLLINQFLPSRTTTEPGTRVISSR